MTPEQKRIAIAEACGWTHKTQEHGDAYWCHPEVMQVCYSPPNYLNDLNAMHEAENSLTNAQRRAYVANLVNVHPLHYDPTLPSDDKWMRIYFLVNATAAQRAEAFLLTINQKTKP
jgi:hypothetical protein